MSATPERRPKLRPQSSSGHDGISCHQSRMICKLGLGSRLALIQINWGKEVPSGNCGWRPQGVGSHLQDGTEPEQAFARVVRLDAEGVVRRRTP
jgi:hypothetical protein